MNRTFLRGLGERAVKTFAQSLLAVLALSSAPLDVFHANWVSALSVSLGATLLSALTSLAGLVPVDGSLAAAAPQVAAPAGDSRKELAAALAALDRMGPETVDLSPPVVTSVVTPSLVPNAGAQPTVNDPVVEPAAAPPVPSA